MPTSLQMAVLILTKTSGSLMEHQVEQIFFGLLLTNLAIRSAWNIPTWEVPSCTPITLVTLPTWDFILTISTAFVLFTVGNSLCTPSSQMHLYKATSVFENLEKVSLHVLKLKSISFVHPWQSSSILSTVIWYPSLRGIQYLKIRKCTSDRKIAANIF